VQWQAVMQQDVNILKQDVSILKRDANILKQDVNILKSRFDKLEKKVDQYDNDMWVLIENEVCDRLDWLSDSVKMYSDHAIDPKITKKIQQHELSYHWVLA